MNFDGLYEALQEKTVAGEKGAANMFYDSVVCVFADGKGFHDKNRITRLFFQGGMHGLSKAQYFRKKKLVRIFYEWLYERNIIEEALLEDIKAIEMTDLITDYDLTRNYFKDLDEALNFISLVGVKAGCAGEDDMALMKTITILLWHDIDFSQMVALKKRDVSLDGYVMVGNIKVEIEEKYLQVLKKFADAQTSVGFPSGRERAYVLSPYLMRSPRQSSMNENNLRCTLKRFNAFAENYGRVISASNLKKNGMLWRAKKEAEKTGEPVKDVVKRLSGCDAALITTYMKMYERWEELIC